MIKVVNLVFYANESNLKKQAVCNVLIYILNIGPEKPVMKFSWEV